MDFDSFKTDTSKEESGVWRPCGKGRILVASSTSTRYKKALQEALKPHETSIALGVMKDEDAKEAYVQSIVEGMLLNWEGFTEHGVECLYSKENATRLLTDVPRFLSFVEAEAKNIENFRQKKEEAEIKNS